MKIREHKEFVKTFIYLPYWSWNIFFHSMAPCHCPIPYWRSGLPAPLRTSL